MTWVVHFVEIGIGQPWKPIRPWFRLVQAPYRSKWFLTTFFQLFHKYQSKSSALTTICDTPACIAAQVCYLRSGSQSISLQNCDQQLSAINPWWIWVHDCRTRNREAEVPVISRTKKLITSLLAQKRWKFLVLQSLRRIVLINSGDSHRDVSILWLIVGGESYSSLRWKMLVLVVIAVFGLTVEVQSWRSSQIVYIWLLRNKTERTAPKLQPTHLFDCSKAKFGSEDAKCTMRWLSFFF